MSQFAAEPLDQSQQMSCCAPTRSRESAVEALPSSPTGPSHNFTDVPVSPVSPVSPADGASGTVGLPGGQFHMGTDERIGFSADGEGPVRVVTLAPFSIDRCAVTNDEFAAFVDDTRHATDAERFGWSFVFAGFLPAEARRVAKRVPGTPWWAGASGATWRRPEGPQSNLAGRGRHPVVHVSWADASAYARWAGKRLPTEAQWEYAARGGLEHARFAWGDELEPGGEHRCNIWQGSFPVKNTGDDGWVGTAPVDAFEPNRYGLYNTAGNVWEWCADWWSTTFHLDGPRVEPEGPVSGDRRVMRGGSYMCHHSYCNRYRVAARSSNTPDSSAGHLGFRCVSD